jgi:flagellar basal-body rod protein FlgB
MAIADVAIFSMLRTRMQWHQDRQKILADNVANSDTPNFRPHDLVELQFNTSGPAMPNVALMRTDAGHQAATESTTMFARSDSGFEIRPVGNAVSLEDEMINVANNQMDFQTVTALYTKSLGLIKLAVGKK